MGYNGYNITLKEIADLLEEKAIIYGRLRRHKEALTIYTCTLMDFPAAERHCVKHYCPETDPSSSEVGVNESAGLIV